MKMTGDRLAHLRGWAAGLRPTGKRDFKYTDFSGHNYI